MDPRQLPSSAGGVSYVTTMTLTSGVLVGPEL